MSVPFVEGAFSSPPAAVTADAIQSGLTAFQTWQLLPLGLHLPHTSTEPSGLIAGNSSNASSFVTGVVVFDVRSCTTMSGWEEFKPKSCHATMLPPMTGARLSGFVEGATSAGALELAVSKR